jgi:hypothetical protein
MQTVPLPYQRFSFQRQGDPLARYHYGPTLHRPFLFPIQGPSGRWLTRMGHPHDPDGHSHHDSVWISHHDVQGVDFWGDRGAGRIRHQSVKQIEDGSRQTTLEVLNHWVAPTSESRGQRVLLHERRRIRIQTLDDDQWLLTLEMEFETPADPVTLGKTPFGMLGVRMAKTIGVHDGGGTIRNSSGGVNEKGVFWKPARWVDYSGAVDSDTIEGITLLDDPDNPNHPSVFHVRDDGWMGASFTFASPWIIRPGEPLRLRYGLFVHRGMPSAELLEQRWKAFASAANEVAVAKSAASSTDAGNKSAAGSTDGGPSDAAPSQAAPSETAP